MLSFVQNLFIHNSVDVENKMIVDIEVLLNDVIKSFHSGGSSLPYERVAHFSLCLRKLELG